MKIAVIAVLFASVLAGADDADRTAGMRNGRWWNKMPIEARFGYLAGVDDMRVMVLSVVDALPHLTAGVDDMRVKVLHLVDVLPQLTPAEVGAAVDLFYKEPTNAPVAVIGALRYVKLKAEGANETELKRLEAELRQLSQ